MKTLYESLLGDLEDNLKAGDNMVKNHKKAEKDFKKLMTKIKPKFTGNFCSFTIKSPELVEEIAYNHPVFRHFKYDYIKRHGVPYPHDVDTFSIGFNCHDAFEGKRRRKAELSIITKSITGRNQNPIIIAAYEYDIDKEIDNTIPNELNNVSLQDCAKVLINAFYKKYNDIESISKDLEQNTVSSARIM